MLHTLGEGLGGVTAFWGAPCPRLSRVPPDDFLLLLCAAQQWRVFEAERSQPWLQAAGDNSDRLDREQDHHNPTPNFIYCKWVPLTQHPNLGWEWDLLWAVNGALCWDGIAGGMSRMGPLGIPPLEFQPWDAKLWGMDKMGLGSFGVGTR